MTTDNKPTTTTNTTTDTKSTEITIKEKQPEETIIDSFEFYDLPAELRRKIFTCNREEAIDRLFFNDYIVDNRLHRGLACVKDSITYTADMYCPAVAFLLMFDYVNLMKIETGDGEDEGGMRLNYIYHETFNLDYYDKYMLYKLFKMSESMMFNELKAKIEDDDCFHEDEQGFLSRQMYNIDYKTIKRDETCKDKLKITIEADMMMSDGLCAMWSRYECDSWSPNELPDFFRNCLYENDGFMEIADWWFPVIWFMKEIIQVVGDEGSADENMRLPDDLDDYASMTAEGGNFQYEKDLPEYMILRILRLFRYIYKDTPLFNLLAKKGTKWGDDEYAPYLKDGIKKYVGYDNNERFWTSIAKDVFCIYEDENKWKEYRETIKDCLPDVPVSLI